MNYLYNTPDKITSELRNFFQNLNLSKTQLNIIPEIIHGMITSQSSNASSIASSLQTLFPYIQFDSITKRIRRLFSNKLFDGYTFYQASITSFLSTYKKKHHDNRIHIIFDHMYSKDNYTVYMISMRLGRQGIPLYFKCFDGIHNSDAFLDSTIIEGLQFIFSLFKDRGFDLVFLADRWFNSQAILDFINQNNATYCIRLKSNLNILLYDQNEKHFIRQSTGDLFAYQCHANYYSNVLLYENQNTKVNIAISKKQDVSEPWIIATNGDPKRAIKDYHYRFGGIETIFKNQKSNGFNLEKVNNASLDSFINMYALVCFSLTWLTMIGIDYSRNSKCYKKTKIEAFKRYKNGKRIRVISLFKIGLILYLKALNSPVYIRLPFSFILYDY